MMEGFFPINHALYVPKVLHMTRDGYSAFLIEPVFFFSFLQQLHEQRVVEVHHRNYKSLLLLSLAHLDRQTPFGYISGLLLVVPMVLIMMMMHMRQQVWMEIPQTFLSTTHNSCQQTKRRQEHETREKNQFSSSPFLSFSLS